MRLLIICSFFLLSIQSLSAQNNFLRLHSFAYLDDPIKTYEVDNIDPKGSSFTPTYNPGYLISLEYFYQLKPSLSFIAGGGFGNHYVRVNYFSSLDLLSNAFQRDYFGSFVNLGMGYAAVYTGLSYSKKWKEQLDFRFNLRLGGYNTSMKNSNSRSSVSKGQLSTQVFESRLIFNESQKLWPMLMPELELTYTFKKIPLGLSLGIASFYSPGVYVGGNLIILGDDDDYMVYLYDRIKSAGLSFSLHYIMK